MKAIEKAHPRRDAICSFFHMNQEAVEAALILAGRLQNGEVSDEMREAAFEYMNKAGFHSVVEDKFKAMAAQMIKEVCDDR